MGRLPAQHVELLEWARERYGRANSGVVDPQKLVRFAAILEMAGSGRQWWSDENADSYVNRLRDGGQGSGFFFDTKLFIYLLEDSTSGWLSAGMI